MKIAYLTHRLPYAANRGDRIRGYYILRHLASRHQVDLVSLVHDDEEESHVRDLAGIAASVTVARVRRTRQASRALHALLTRAPLTHALLDAAHFHERLSEVVERRRPDVALTLCSGMARFALAPPLAGRPFVLDMVDVDSEKWAALGREASEPQAYIYRREAGLLRNFERYASNAADATLVVNERERQSLVAMGVTGRIDVVPNGVELTSLRRLSPPTAEPRVVFCGVMNYEPNETGAIWLAREVWPHVRRTRPDARLTLVGSNPTRRVLRLAEEDPSVEVTGSVPDVRPFLWNSAVSVAPLFVARGVQNKVLEAAAAGLPTVVTKAVFEGLPPEVLPACVMAGGAEAFAAEILRLLALAPQERHDIGRRARLDSLAWAKRLEPLDDILSAAGSVRRIA